MPVDDTIHHEYIAGGRGGGGWSRSWTKILLHRIIGSSRLAGGRGAAGRSPGRPRWDFWREDAECGGAGSQ